MLPGCLHGGKYKAIAGWKVFQNFLESMKDINLYEGETLLNVFASHALPPRMSHVKVDIFALHDFPGHFSEYVISMDKTDPFMMFELPHFRAVIIL